MRSIEYVADEYGFYPKLSHQPHTPEDTDAVKLATNRHYQLYNRIAEAHQNPEVSSRLSWFFSYKVLNDFIFFNKKGCWTA